MHGLYTLNKLNEDAWERQNKLTNALESVTSLTAHNLELIEKIENLEAEIIEMTTFMRGR